MPTNTADLPPHEAIALRLSLFICLLLLAGCQGNDDFADRAFPGQGPVRLAKKDQEQIDFCYLVVRRDLEEFVELSAVQRVTLGVYGNRLRHILNYYTSDATDHTWLVTQQMNDPAAKISRTLDLAKRIEASLEPKQITAFQQARRRLKLHPIEPVAGAKRYMLRYTLKGDESGREVARKNGPKELLVVMPTGDAEQWAQWLTNTAEIREALLSDESEVRRAGLKRLESFPMAEQSLDERKRMADVLLSVMHSPETHKWRRQSVVMAFSKLATPAHREALVALAKSAKGAELEGAVAGLSRVAPSDAVAQAISRSESFVLFCRCLDGFTLHGKDAESSLVALDEELQGEHRFWIQKTLREIGSSHQLPNTGASLQRTATESMMATTLGRMNLASQSELHDARVTSPAPVSDVEDWLAALRDERPEMQAEALKQYQLASRQLRVLPKTQQQTLTRLCVERMKSERNSLIASKYGELLLESSGPDSVNLFKTLCASRSRTARCYGLAGLMRFSQAEAVRTITRYEEISLGMHDVAKAADLAGRAAVPALKAAHPLLKNRISQMKVERKLDELQQT